MEIEKLVLTNYCYPDCEPLKNIMRLPKKEAFAAAGALAEAHPETMAFYRFADFENYYPRRLMADAFLYRRFLELGGEPEEEHPLSFVIGECDYLREWFGNGIRTQIPLQRINPKHISFTIGDSSAMMERNGTVDMLTLPMLAKRLDACGGDMEELLKGHNCGYVEVQLWSDTYIRDLKKA